MEINVDRRTRVEADAQEVDAAQWFRRDLPDLAWRHSELLARAGSHLDLPALELDVAGLRTTLELTPAGLRWSQQADSPRQGAGLQVSLSAEAFSSWVTWMRSVMSLMLAGELQLHGDFAALRAWELVLRTLTDGVPVYRPGDVTFVERDGSPLNLDQVFGPQDDPARVAWFYRQTGFLHLRGWLAEEQVQAIDAQVLAAVSRYRDGDGRSWWATLENGERVCVRMQEFHREAPAVAELLAGPRWEQLRATIAAGEAVAHNETSNPIEALIKMPGVKEGISDVPWHRDCTFGAHPYRCAASVVGISATDGAAANGLLRVVPGSHRASSTDDPTWIGNDLPIRELPTLAGDLTVHMSCTIHEARPPVSTGRRVLYTEFPLQVEPDNELAKVFGTADPLRAVVHQKVSQPSLARR